MFVFDGRPEGEDPDCQVGWTVSGDHCADCELGWDVHLQYLDSLSTCSAGHDLDGVLEFKNGSAYFGSYYWGQAEVVDGDITWITTGYIPGVYGYYYYYQGQVSY